MSDLCRLVWCALIGLPRSVVALPLQIDDHHFRLKHPCAPIRAIRCLRPTSLPKAGTGTSTWLRSIPIIQNPIRSASTWPICSNCSTTAINGGGPEYYGDRRRRNSNCRCPHGRVSHSSSQLRDSNPPPEGEADIHSPKTRSVHVRADR